MKSLTHKLFCDELEFQKTENHKLTLYFFGILIKAEMVKEIEKQILSITKKLGKVSFHSIKHYKNKSNWDIFEKFNEIIILNKLEIFCFPLVKDWFQLDVFNFINTLSLPEWPTFPVNNYRAKAFILFLHVLNYHFNKKNNDTTYLEIIADEDWLKVNQMIQHQGTVLNKIDNVLSSRQKRMPLLALSDHIAYLYNKVKKGTYFKNHKPSKEIIIDKFSEMSFETFKNYGKYDLFNFLDLKEWTKYSEEKVK